MDETGKDFAAFLAGARAAEEQSAPAAAWPSMPPSFLSQAATERRKQARSNFAADAYRDIMEVEEEPAAAVEVLSEEPCTDPDIIAGELNLAGCLVERDFDKARREFAKASHPDRAPERHRELAMLRMQIANQLIDEAKRGFHAGR